MLWFSRGYKIRGKGGYVAGVEGKGGREESGGGRGANG